MLAVTSPQGAVAEPYFPLEHSVNIGVADLHSFPEGNLSVIYVAEKKSLWKIAVMWFRAVQKEYQM